MGFSDAEDNKPVHVIQLKSGIEAQKILLPVHKFSSVDSCKLAANSAPHVVDSLTLVFLIFVVTMFVESNCSDGESDITIIKGLNVFGQPISGTDVSQIKKQGWCVILIFWNFVYFRLSYYWLSFHPHVFVDATNRQVSSRVGSCLKDPRLSPVGV